MPVHHVPEGYHALTPYLIVKGAARALDFYRDAFGAVELFRMPGPDGRIGHAEMQVGDSRFMIADEHPEIGAVAPAGDRVPVGFCLYVPDVDAVFVRAVALGGTATRPVEDRFYGDRSGMLTDPFGHNWSVSTHVEDVPPEELERRAAAAHGG